MWWKSASLKSEKSIKTGSYPQDSGISHNISETLKHFIFNSSSDILYRKELLIY